ncbi:MAG: IS110 family transposase ISChy2 [Anaerolineales bacterium]|nr:IS110 family transposase ISChy2 [Anaerolineales bacterium]MCC6326147.1 IS110 family transposase [Candidatus Brocadia sp.]MDG5995477.1 IS110 family transposase [Candidatus Brocadia sp.]
MKDIKTEKGKKINKKSLIVALDVAQEKHVVYIRSSDGREEKPFVVFNRREEYEQMWRRISQTKEAYGLEEVVVGFESTGPYAEPLVHYLMKKEVKLVQVNPMHTKRVKEIRGNSPNKTDEKDPQVIADIMELGNYLRVVIPEGVSAELRRLTHARERAVERRTMLVNQVHGLMSVIFPEFAMIMKDIKTKTAYYLLKHYPRPQDIVELGYERLEETLKKISRGRMGKDRAEALYEGAVNTVGVREGQGSIVFEIKQLVVEIEQTERLIEEMEEKMREYLKEIPYSRYMLSIQGVGEVTVAGLIGEVGDFRKYRTIAEITKLAGLDLFEVSSGKHKEERHISKRGRPLMRKLLFCAAINVVREGRIMHERYKRYLQRGVPRMKALIAIARKLLGVLFALVRDQREYVKNYEEIRLKQVA